MKGGNSLPKALFFIIGLLALGLAATAAFVSNTNQIQFNYGTNPAIGSYHDGADLGLRGIVHIVLFDADGNVKDERHFDNLIVDSGFEGIASRIAPHDGTVNPGGPFNYIALGTGSSPVSPLQTALVSELPTGPAYSRQLDSQATYTDSSGKQLSISVVFPSGQATGTINESGLFDAAAGGDMLARQTFSTINKGASDTLTVTWTIALSTTP